MRDEGMKPLAPSARKAEIHERLLEASRGVEGKGEMRAFRKALAKAVGRSEEAVAKWLGDRAEMTGPPATVLEKCESWLAERS